MLQKSIAYKREGIKILIPSISLNLISSDQNACWHTQTIIDECYENRTGFILLFYANFDHHTKWSNSGDVSVYLMIAEGIYYRSGAVRRGAKLAARRAATNFRAKRGFYTAAKLTPLKTSKTTKTRIWGLYMLSNAFIRLYGQFENFRKIAIFGIFGHGAYKIHDIDLLL